MSTIELDCRSVDAAAAILRFAGWWERKPMKLKLVVLALGIVWASQAAADSFNQFISFGDSTADSGWWSGALNGSCDGAPSPCTTGSTTKNTLIQNAINAGATGAPVGAGFMMNTQILAADFGLTALPANQPGGTNYAISGAYECRDTGQRQYRKLEPEHDSSIDCSADGKLFGCARRRCEHPGPLRDQLGRE